MARLSAKPLNGVNLGGWLVLERWMTPALFAGTKARDEYSFMQTPDALAKLRKHQREFIREEDWKWLRKNGIQIVRLPVGYWVFDGDGPYHSCIGKLDWAVQMSQKYQIKLLICLHGALGSQNGYNHSGQIGKANWHNNADYQKQTIDILVRLAERYRSQSAVWGIELLNEPKIGLWQLTLRRFYGRAYREIIKVARPGLVTVFSDAFTPRLMNGALRAKPGFPVMMDHHWYHFLMPRQLQRWLPLGLYGRWLQLVKSPLLGRLRRAQPIIIGEWSGVIGSSKLHKFEKSRRMDIVKWHIDVQQQAYSYAYATFYWNYKIQSSNHYNFRAMVEEGRIVLNKR